jgi:transcriptional regulator with XRE-family HTH domain
MEIAAAIRGARRQAGLTQRELAKRALIPQSTIARIESGAVKPRAGTLEKILGVLGVELTFEPRLGIGVDTSLIARMLALTTRERIEYATAAGEGVRRLRDAAAMSG